MLQTRCISEKWKIGKQWQIKEQCGFDWGLALLCAELGAPGSCHVTPACSHQAGRSWDQWDASCANRSSWHAAPPAQPSLCHRFCLLGCFQPCQDFIPLHKLLGEKQGLDMTLKESNAETARKKPRGEHPDSTATILIPLEWDPGHQAVESLHGLDPPCGRTTAQHKLPRESRRHL